MLDILSDCLAIFIELQRILNCKFEIDRNNSNLPKSTIKAIRYGMMTDPTCRIASLLIMKALFFLFVLKIKNI